MCIIIYKKAGIEVKEEWMDNSAANNPHGFGLCFVNEETGELEIHRTLEYEAFKLIYEEVLEENPDTDILLHFRKNTCGETNEENCHPFLISDGLAMMHNGTIKPCEPPKPNKWAKEEDKETRSDTRIFAEDYLRHLPFGWERNTVLHKIIGEFIGDSKIVTMDKTGHVEIINEDKGAWREGLWVSNFSYYPNTRSLQKYEPRYWNANVETKTTSEKVKVTVEDSEFFCLVAGKRYRWDRCYNGWRQCQLSTDNFVYGAPTLHSLNRNPVYAFEYNRYNNDEYDFTVVKTYECEQVSLPLKDKNATIGDCDWCGKTWHKEHLNAVGCKGRDGIEDISLMCNKCIREFYSDADGDVYGLDVLKKYDVEALIINQNHLQGY